MDETQKDPAELKNWSPPIKGVTEEDVTSRPDRPRPYRGVGKVHQGADISAPIGTPVRAIADGKIKYIYNTWQPGDGQTAGNFVQIQHSNGLISEYMHLSKIGRLRVDQRVSGGENIGETGNSGGNRALHSNAEPMAPHLHFSVLADDDGKNKKYDPMKFLLFSPSGSLRQNATTHDLGLFDAIGERVRSWADGVFGKSNARDARPIDPAKTKGESKLKEQWDSVDEIEAKQDIDLGRNLARRLKSGEVTEQEDELETPDNVRRPPLFKPAMQINQLWQEQRKLQNEQERQRTLQRDEQGRQDQLRRSQSMLAAQVQQNLRDTQARLAQADRNRQTAMQQQTRDQSKLRELLQRQSDERNRTMADAARRRDADFSKELAQRQANQQRQDQLSRVAQMSRPPAMTSNSFAKPFVSPRLWSSPAQPPINLPAHIYTAPAPIPSRPPSFTQPTFSRPPTSHLYS